MPFTHFENHAWNIPEYFNIAVACTDAHLGTPTENRVAMIVEDDAIGTSQATYGEFAASTARFASSFSESRAAAPVSSLATISSTVMRPWPKGSPLRNTLGTAMI